MQSPVQVLRKVFLLQGFWRWFISLPLQLSATTGPTPQPLLAVTALGVAVWLVGVIFEAVGDRQLRVVQIRPGQSRRDHGPRPVGLDPPPQLLRRRVRLVGVVADQHQRPGGTGHGGSPLLMTYFLVHVTGARLTEKYMRRPSRLRRIPPRTSFFVPAASSRPDRRGHDDRSRRLGARLPIDDRTTSLTATWTPCCAGWLAATATRSPRSTTTPGPGFTDW